VSRPAEAEGRDSPELHVRAEKAAGTRIGYTGTADGAFQDTGFVHVRQNESASDDQELVRRCQAGEEAAFAELVQKYQQVLLKIIYHNLGPRGDAEDISQKVLAKAYFSLPRFDNERPFLPWLYRIAVNQCYDELRRQRRRKSLTFSELNVEDIRSIENLLRNDEPPEHAAEDRRDLHDLLYKMLDLLPEKQRRALVLRDLEDVPYEKMAELMDCSEQAARLKVFRARSRLRDMMLKAMRRRDRSRGPDAGA
jgi:RNA polymerase sigma-70 factor (ECF subfamily)